MKGSGQSNLILLSPAGVSRAFASLLLMCPEKARNSCSAFPASDALIGFIQDFEDVISFDFSESSKSCIAPRNLEITLSETNKVVINNYKSGSADSLPRRIISKRHRYEKQIKALHLFRLLSLEMLHRRIEIEKQDFRKEHANVWFIVGLEASRILIA